jgi:glucose/arabinose dehydrogenase
MKKIIKYLFILTLIACTKKVDPPILEQPIENEPETVFYEPVETNQANTGFIPAFEGQTRIEGIRTTSDYHTTVLTEELISPWGIDVLPNGDFVITERFGSIRVLTVDGELSPSLYGFPSVNSSEQGGLLDILVSQDFEESRLLYFTLAESTTNGSLTAVGRGRLADDISKIEDFEIIYRAYPYYYGNNHFGSRIVFDHDGNLFVSTGDRQSLETRPNAQKIENGHGKILHITTDGDPIETNPFYRQSNAHQEIYSIGHRNVQGLAIHPITGELWANEMGPQGGDELNRIESGKNYGWPIISYGEEYNGSPVGDGITQLDGLEQPIYYWDPVIAPSGMIFYDSDQIPEWQNNLFISGLKGQHIIRLLIEDNIVIGEERLLESEGQRFRDITVGLDGALYTITDSGRLYRVGP